MDAGPMRALVAATLVLLVVLAAGVPHEHVRAHDAADCIACAVGQGDAARVEAPDVAPPALVVAVPMAEPGPSPVAGAPIGAIPGQSPPAGA
jgi:hypothetical protein